MKIVGNTIGRWSGGHVSSSETETGPFMSFPSRRTSALLLSALFCMLCVPYLLHYYLTSRVANRVSPSVSSASPSSPVRSMAPSGSPFDSDDDIFINYEGDKYVVDGVAHRLEEMNRVRVSLLDELRLLEEKKHHLRMEIDALLVQSDRLQTQLRQGVKDLERVRVSIEQAHLVRKELAERNIPEISLPAPLFPGRTPRSVGLDYDASECSMSACFDYSRCSVTTGYPVYIYEPHSSSPDIIDVDLVRLFGGNVYAVDDPSSACLFVVALKRGAVVDRRVMAAALPFWNNTGDGANHLIINVNASVSHLGRSLLASHAGAPLRFGFDVLMPSFHSVASGNDEEDTSDWPALIPIRRRYLLSVLSCEGTVGVDVVTGAFTTMRTTKTDDVFYFAPGCGTASASGPSFQENRVLELSTFTLILILEGRAPSVYLSTFMDALKYGAVPVVVTHSGLPYQHYTPLGETLDWRMATVQLPLARLPELHFYLRSLQESDIVRMRQHGRVFYRNYFSTRTRLMETVLAVVRHRLNIPAAPVRDTVSSSYFNTTHQPTFGQGNDAQAQTDADEYLGPVESPYPSPKFEQNTSMVGLYSYDVWNVYADPFRTYPHSPFTKHPLPSEAKFMGTWRRGVLPGHPCHPKCVSGSPYGFRPISAGAGGSGKEFSQSLGGNFPREQFTVVLLTYEREQVLMAALNRLNNLPYLNKVVVVWNGPTPPNPHTIWPKITAPIVVVKTENNSLNNRFLPYREIETEAVLSMDDDVHLRRDEIIFAFRVWREGRDRLVGFPARFHAWQSEQKQWTYNSNHSCQLSMVLTGAAFIHKYYLYMYTYNMPAVIRWKVDQLMNCEDIAMNFLIAHMTKKAPLKTTSRWTFRCPGCPETLSADQSHFIERHDCLNYLVGVYGYNPLLYTQFRVDSILFKMRIPQNHQKCFRFI